MESNIKHYYIFQSGIHEYDMEIEKKGVAEEYRIYTSLSSDWSDNFRGMLCFKMLDEGNGGVFIDNKFVEKQKENIIIGYSELEYLRIIMTFQVRINSWPIDKIMQEYEIIERGEKVIKI